jgi:hypothetical protein
MSSAIFSGSGGAAQLAATTNSILPNIDPMWSFASIDGSRWNEAWPYQLVTFTVTNGNYSPLNTFTLPMAPQQESVGMAFAMVPTATIGGVVEQNNGAPFRDISLSGTTGVQVLLPGPSVLATALNIGSTIIAGSVGLLVNTSIGGSVNASANVISNSDSEPGGSLEKSSGYYQFMLLQQYLEAYAAAKKTSAGNNLRLGLAIWKNQEVFLVTPQSLTRRREAGKPFEYMYTLQLRAWRRIPFSGATGSNPLNTAPSIGAYTQAALQSVGTAVTNARTLLG